MKLIDRLLGDVMDRKLFPKIRFKSGLTLTSQIYDFLRHQIVAKRIAPGTSLSENDLAAHFNVSRQPVHEALNKLCVNGLIDIMPQKGTFVSKISVNNLFEICFMRCAIECQSIRKSTCLNKRSFNRICNKLSKCLDQQRKWLANNEPNEKFLDLDDTFHQTICEFSQTALAWNVLYSVKANMDRIRYLTIGTISEPCELITTHEQILECILNHDIDKSCELIENHSYEITHTYSYIIEQNKEWFLDESEEKARI